MTSSTAMPKIAHQLDWMDEAECRSDDIDLFFGLDGERGGEKDRREALARKVCLRCPVLDACQRYALMSPQKYGFWGGLAEDEREAWRRRRMRQARAA